MKRAASILTVLPLASVGRAPAGEPDKPNIIRTPCGDPRHGDVGETTDPKAYRPKAAPRLAEEARTTRKTTRIPEPTE